MACVLVADDDVEIREMLQGILEHAGYDVLTAGTGKEAMSICHEKQCDLVIMDMIMPTQNGMQTISEVRRGFPSTKIIAISGGATGGPGGYLIRTFFHR